MVGGIFKTRGRTYLILTLTGSVLCLNDGRIHFVLEWPDNMEIYVDPLIRNKL